MNTCCQGAASSAAATDLTGEVYAYGLSGRKLRFLRCFSGGATVRSVTRGGQVPSGATLALWGSSPLPEGCPADISIVRLEDGFLRSVGLGADLVRPLSWVIDGRGIYYDSGRPSDLELLLQTGDFTPDLIDRAKRLCDRIVASGLTKYNVGNESWSRPPGGGRCILVPGQVESDASIRCGAPGIATNLGLLQAVRRTNPGAYLLYKPHPDVVAGLRRQGAGEGEALNWCDEVIHDVSMGDLLPLVDEVHLLTSLAGFEALLRRKPVTCYGQPFYAGWGLTRDMLPIERRTRTLELHELVAGALLLYPRYMGRQSGRLTTPELALDELLAWRARSSSQTTLWQRLKRVFLRRIVGVR